MIKFECGSYLGINSAWGSEIKYDCYGEYPTTSVGNKVSNRSGYGDLYKTRDYALMGTKKSACIEQTLLGKSLTETDSVEDV